MFEIPDDDESFWNDVPMEDSFPSKSGHITGKENRPQLRVPDTACTGNPAKRLCMQGTDFIRDGMVQAEKSLPQFRSVNNTNLSEQREDSRIYTESPFHIPFPTTSPLSTSASASSVSERLDTSSGGNNSKASERKAVVVSKTENSGVTESTATSLDRGRTSISNHGYGNHGNKSVSVASKNVVLETENLNGERFRSSDINMTACSGTASTGSRMMTSQAEGTNIQADRNRIHVHDSGSTKVMSDQNKQRDSSSVTEGVNRSRSLDVGDHVTPKRKRKFPGPAGILPKLGPGRSLDTFSPATLNTTPTVTNNSPQDDSVILCSQSTDDIFSDSPWQTLLTDMGEDGQKLLKKFSISSTLLKAGKRQLSQGKAALIFGVIDTIESHGSEASVTIRDRSGRMQGTIHHDLFKEHETDLQAGTVLVLKQVSIISLSNRNHYLNITPNNVVVLYCGGQSSLRTMKFHSSEDSLQSVLSALEKKAAAHRINPNNSVTMTPSSLNGSSRQSVTGSGTGTPQLFTPSPRTPVSNQQLFSPRTPVTGHQASLRSPVPAAVRDVSVVHRNSVPTYPRFGNSTPNANFRPGVKTSAGIGSVSPQLSTESTLLCTPNTNFKVVPVQNNINFSQFNPSMNRSLNNSSSSSNVINVSVKTPVQQQTYQKQPVSGTPSAGVKSKWKFKSPPGRSGSLPASPDVSGPAGINKIGHVNGFKPGVSSSTGHASLSNGGGVIRSSAAQTSVGNVAQNTSSGNTCRSWQLNNQNFVQNTETSSNKTNDNGTKTAWSFKSSTSNTSNGKQTITSKSDTQISEDNLWEDDFSDDLLSQLSDDLT